MIDAATEDQVLEESPAERAEASPAARTDAAESPLFTRLRERVTKKYGAFGERAQSEQVDERRILGEASWRPMASLIGGVFVASTLLAFLSRPTYLGGDWANSFRLDTVFVAIWGPLLYWALARQKLWKSARTYLVLALFIEAFSEIMLREKGEGGYWDSVLWPASVAYFGTLKEFSGLPGASLPVFFFATIGLLGRAVWGKKAADWEAPPKFARDALLAFLGVIVLLVVVGVARGGQVDWTFRQVIHMFQLPLVGLVFLYVLRVPRDLAAIGTAFVLTAVVRALLVAYVYIAVCIPQGITSLPGKPEWCTTHSDTVLFVSALVILFVHALEQRSKDSIKKAAMFGAIILVGIVLNNRRLAFVSLALALLVIYLALDPSKRKRRVTIALAVTLPLLLGYVLVGSESTSDSPLLKPAKSIVSVLDQRDTSSISRDIENENLIYTLRQSPLLTSGFGHEYLSSPNNPPVDLTDVFKNYRIIAHNGVLWLWSIAGVIGFTLLWAIYPLAGTLAVRAYRFAPTSLERSSALAALGCTSVCAIQIWGDQGFSSYMTLVTFGVAFAVAARLAAGGSVVSEETVIE